MKNKQWDYNKIIKTIQYKPLTIPGASMLFYTNAARLLKDPAFLTFKGTFIKELELEARSDFKKNMDDALKDARI